MTSEIVNDAGETVYVASSDAEACRWYLDNGRRGDYLKDSGGLMSALTMSVLDVTVHFDRNGCVTS